MVGGVHVYLGLTLVPNNISYYYYNFSSSINDQIVLRGSNNRVRSCPTGYTFY